MRQSQLPAALMGRPQRNVGRAFATPLPASVIKIPWSQLDHLDVNMNIVLGPRPYLVPYEGQDGAFRRSERAMCMADGASGITRALRGRTTAQSLKLGGRYLHAGRGMVWACYYRL